MTRLLTILLCLCLACFPAPAQQIYAGQSIPTRPNCPANNIGVDNAWYLDWTTGNAYGPKTLGQWPCSPITSLLTSTGPRSLTGLWTFNDIPTSPLGIPSGLSNPLAAFVNVPSDNAASGSNGAHIPTALDVEMYSGGSNIDDGRNSFASYFDLTAPTSPSNTYRFYTSGNFFADINTDDNGTNSVPEGNVDGIGIVARIRAGATHWRSQLGVEINTASDAGSGVLTKAGLAILPWPEDAVHGSLVDAAIWYSASAGAASFFNFIQIDANGGEFPIPAAGTFVKLIGGTIATGIDLNTTTITGNALQWGGSFSLAGNGNAVLGLASFAVNAVNPIEIGLWSVAGYGMQSFNSSFVSGSALGIAGGNTSDPNLYAVMPANGSLVVRSNGATSNTLTIGNPSPGTATKTVVADASGNWFSQAGFSGTKVAGSCTFTLLAGAVTNITGC